MVAAPGGRTRHGGGAVRRWEFIGDRFCDVLGGVVEGASVRVRHGRIGTEGRIRVKELDCAAAASAQFGRLVTEKERKGCSEVEAAVDPEPRTDQEAAPVAKVGELPDEDTFVLPG
ncbi:WGR domain-containing protein [Streptomyces sp. NPDC001380]|uniref:WGR domain-containing protein n=1 Tax=Streptomyces sp. NPDC001380 TaxID=3364566 RepID=UPI0036C97E09